jgi:hypothetical protein
VIYDRDGDGVSELPYSLETTYEVLADRRPALAFFDGTPAADAIDAAGRLFPAAGRLFPIFAPRPKLTDAHPLAHPVLSAWTEQRAETERDPRLAASGLGLLLLGGIAMLQLKREGVR